MTFSSIPQYDATTPGNNTDIGGVSVAEGWPAANINNSIRQLLTQLKQYLANSATVASASTVDLGAQTANYITISGTTTITSFGAVASGTWRLIEFSGAVPITYNATSMILPTAASITAAAGDTALFVSRGSGNWKCLAYLKTSGLPLANPTGSAALGVVGNMRNARMSTTAATASATFLADEIIVETALGGSAYKLTSYSQVINLATTGAGGMDTGTAPVSGFVSLYAIYNPTTATASILACAQATSNGSIYSGANMPSGYTASALIGSWPTNGSSQFPIAGQIDRKVYTLRTNVLSITAAVPTSYTNVSLASAVPTNARSWSGIMGAPSNVSYLMSVAADTNGMGAQQGGAPSTTLSQDSFFNGSIICDLIITVSQQTYYKSGGGSTTARIDVTAYTF